MWVPTVFIKNRERLVAQNTVIELFNLVLVQAVDKGMLSGEYFSGDVNPMQPCRGTKLRVEARQRWS
ncbi:hypothetical protein RD110_10070 [Rhodoferax koreense]|uniref:Uncharacterized protein n=1 Tax=Rhodoferax koreensis TaxID=1842727 RepID=A0A1P8JUR6_9BURK|nr:hypothetical protein [Rhodoferax koreense]APW37493.1 hypothetical protein RD110_10070 [Rhodoferax koreense]